MSDVFISYSRKDGEFVQRLNNALVSKNQSVWVDWQNIPRGEDWWQEITSGIENADTFLCVISEHWLTSEICLKELQHARQHHKRIFPLIRQRIEGETEIRVKGLWAVEETYEQLARDSWNYIRHLNWIFFDQDEKFETEFTALLKAMEQDQPHIKAHTRYQNRALEWERSSKNPSFLLSGDDLAFAEKWLQAAIAEKHTPAPTKEHQTYIETSRQVENTRIEQEQTRQRQTILFRRAAAGLAIIGTLAVLGAIFSGFTANNALNQVSDANSTLTPVQNTLSAANNQLITATIAQGNAEQREQEAITAVAVANATLTPIPVTLTAVAQN